MEAYHQKYNNRKHFIWHIHWFTFSGKRKLSENQTSEQEVKRLSSEEDKLRPAGAGGQQTQGQGLPNVRDQGVPQHRVGQGQPVQGEGHARGEVQPGQPVRQEGKRCIINSAKAFKAI